MYTDDILTVCMGPVHIIMTIIQKREFNLILKLLLVDCTFFYCSETDSLNI